MIPSLTNPFLARRRLRTELTRARQRAGFTQHQVAEALGVSLSTVVRAETGVTGISVRDVAAYVGLYGSADRLDELTQLARDSRSLPWRNYKDVVSKESLEFFGYEAAADVRRQFQNAIVPGLLQTPDYTHALLTGAFDMEVSEAERSADLRRERQMLAFADASTSHFVLDEAVLRRVVGDESVMRRQLDHILGIADSERVAVQILPLTAGTNFSMRGPFILLEFENDEDQDILYLENPAGDTILKDGAAAIRPYRHGFDQLSRLATAPEHIEKAIERYSRRPAG